MDKPDRSGSWPVADTYVDPVEPDLDTSVFTRAGPTIDQPNEPSTLGDPDQRYVTESQLGVGGMGSVLLCQDRQIGRRVALKMIRPELSGETAAVNRFVREARIQGQLEHPAMVPVYDLGAENKGAVYFTMKRVHGVTLKKIVKGLQQDRQGYRERFTLRKLLTAFSSICLAVDFAHQRGVLHRDIKPGNIMLGEFGEVSLLDWGVAKLIGKADLPVGAPIPMPESDEVDTGDSDVDTAAGSLLGTPGYISPEQILGRDDADQPAADVYALGAVLFFILAWQRLAQPGPPHTILASTAAGLDARASVRAPEREVPPELEAICVKATALDPADRYHSARALADDIEQYLDGRRDDELRQKLAERHAGRAEALLADEPLEGSSTQRRQALREVGRALALDPDNERAVQTMMQVLTDPPKEVPAEVETQIRDHDTEMIRWMARLSSLVYLSHFLYLPLFLAAGIRNVTAVTVFYGLVGTCVIASMAVSRLARPSQNAAFVAHSLTSVTLGGSLIFFGPLVLMPVVLAINTAAFCIVLTGRYRVSAVATSALIVIVPAVFELVGVGIDAYEFTEAGMVIVPNAIHLAEVPAVALLGTTSLASLLTGAVAVSRIRDSLQAARKEIYLNNWLIRQLIPARTPR